MFSKIFKRSSVTGNDTSHTSSSKASDEKSKKIVVLVIKAPDNHEQNFYDLFSKCRLKDGSRIAVEQAAWTDIQLTSYSDSLKPVVNLRPSIKPLPKTRQNQMRCIQPDFVLIRDVVRGIKPGQDYRNLLYGFLMSQTPSINSLHSVFCMAERAVMTAELIRLNRLYGQAKFPIFTQNYYPMHEEMLITPSYPLVLKVGSGHAGFGKILLQNHKQFGDMKSIVATTSDYCTAEKYIEGKYDLRLQKIGDNYQAYKRVSMSGNWKTNTGTSMIEMVEVTERYRWWMDECSKAFGGGLHICTVDVLVAESDGKEYILEFNGTASGFGDTDKDNLILRDYVLRRLNEYFVDGEKELNLQQYPNNDDLVRDVKDLDKYDDEKYVSQTENKDNDDDGDDVDSAKNAKVENNETSQTTQQDTVEPQVINNGGDEAPQNNDVGNENV